MAFDFGSFFAGASEGAATAITNRNKEIRNGALRQFDQLVSEAESKEKGLRTERDVLSTQAKTLAGFRGMNNAGLTPNQILGLIQQPEYAKSLIKRLESTEDLSQIDLSTVFKLDEKNKGTEMSPEAYGVKKTSIPADQAAGQATKPVRGAFGLESPAYSRAEEEFLRNTGRKISDVRAIARGTIDLGADFKPMQGTLDLSQFAKPEAIVDIQGKLRDAIANKEDLKSPKNTRLQNQLSAAASVKNMFKEDGDKTDKPRAASAINSVIDRSLKANLYPYEEKGVIRWEKDNPEPIIIAGADPKEIASYIEVKNKHIESQFKDLGIINIAGTMVDPKDRNARDALLPYANVDSEGSVSWRKPAAPRGTTPPPTTNAPQSVVMLPQKKAIPRKAPPNIDPAVWNAMSPEEQALF